MASEDDAPTPFKMSPVTALPEVAPEVRRVAGAGNGLVVTGVAGILLNCLMHFGSMWLAPAEPPRLVRDLQAKADALDPAAAERGAAAAPGTQLCVIALPTLLVYPLAIVGGLRLKRLESYGLVLASSIVVMLPCSCAVVLGLPVGLWALTLLADPSIKSKFREHRP
jgi:hypothetical protein